MGECSTNVQTSDRIRGNIVARAGELPVVQTMTKSPIAIVLALLSLSALGVPLEQNADEIELRRMERACSSSLVASDIKGLAEILAPDWKLVASDAAILTREQLFNDLRDGGLKFESYDSTDIEVRLYGDAAIVIGIGKSTGKWKGEAFKQKERFTDVFVRTDGKWRCVSSQSSDFPADGEK